MDLSLVAGLYTSLFLDLGVALLVYVGVLLASYLTHGRALMMACYWRAGRAPALAYDWLAGCGTTC